MKTSNYAADGPLGSTHTRTKKKPKPKRKEKKKKEQTEKQKKTKKNKNLATTRVTLSKPGKSRKEKTR